MSLPTSCLSAHKDGEQELQLSPQVESTLFSVSLKHCETNLGQYLPIDVGIADAACEILRAGAGRPSVVESFRSRN